LRKLGSVSQEKGFMLCKFRPADFLAIFPQPKASNYYVERLTLCGKINSSNENYLRFLVCSGIN